MRTIAKLKDEARRHEQGEAWSQAIDVYLQVLKMADEGGAEIELPLFNRVGDLYIRLGKADEAVRHYETAADRYAEAGLYNNAIALCNKALRYTPSRTELLRKLGQFSAKQGFVTDARRWYLEYAEKMFAAGATDAAFGALEDFADLIDDASVRELLGRKLATHGRQEAALSELKRAHGMRLAAGDHDAAATLLAEIEALDPSAVAGRAAADSVPSVADAIEEPYYGGEGGLEGLIDIDVGESPTPPAGPEAAAEEAIEAPLELETTHWEAPGDLGQVETLGGFEPGFGDAGPGEFDAQLPDLGSPAPAEGFDGLEQTDLASAAAESDDDSGFGDYGEHILAVDGMGEDGEYAEPLPLLGFEGEPTEETSNEAGDDELLEAVQDLPWIEPPSEFESGDDFAESEPPEPTDGVPEEPTPAPTLPPGAEPPLRGDAPPVAAPSDGFVDLGALLAADSPEERTRFFVEEKAPTGNEDEDFAEMLLQFKARVADHIGSEDVASHYDLGLAYKEMGLLDEAISEFQIALRGGHDPLRIYEELGQCFHVKGDHSIAVKILSRALEGRVANDLELIGVYYFLGRSYEELGRPVEAKDAYERILALDLTFRDVGARVARL